MFFIGQPAVLVLIELAANYPGSLKSLQAATVVPPAEIAFHLTGEVTTGRFEWCSLRNFNKRPAGGIDHSVGIREAALISAPKSVVMQLVLDSITAPATAQETNLGFWIYNWKPFW